MSLSTSPPSPSPAAQDSTMRLAEILSDLVSLRVCDPKAARALVSARCLSTTQDVAPAHTDDDDTENDAELKRAKDLLKLHYEVKQASKRGDLGRGLREARGMVDRAVAAG